MNRLLNKEELVRLRYLFKVNVKDKTIVRYLTHICLIFEKTNDEDLNRFLLKAYRKYEDGKNLKNGYIVPNDLISS